MSIKWKSYLACIVILALIVIMGVFITIQVHNILWDKTSHYTEQIIQKISYDIDIMLGELDWQTGQLVFDRDVQALVQGNNASSVSARVQTKLGTTLESLPRHVTGGDILIVSPNMQVLASTSPDRVGKYRMLGVEWANKVIEAKGNSVRITGYSVSKGEALRNTKVVNIARGIFVDGRYYGMLMLDIPTQSFESVCTGAAIGTNGFISIIDPEKYVIFSTNPLDMGNRFNRVSLQLNPNASSFIGSIGGEEMFFAKMKSEFSGMTVVGALPLAEVFLPSRQLTRNIFLAISAFGIGVLAITLWIVLSISQPILHLALKMKQVGIGDLSVRIQERRHDEIGTLEKGFNRMLDQVQDLINREYRANLHEREAQLSELTAIINPHFMYNTLEAISMKAYLNNDEQVVEMLTGLARLFRIMTNNTLRYITIDEELNHCTTYLELMSCKDDPSLSYFLSVADDLRSCYTLKFLLQPFVENCIIHGFSNRNYGTIHLDICHKDDAVIITIEDDGEGLSESELKGLQTRLTAIDADIGKPSVLKNIQERIQLAFGNTYGVSLFKNKGGGITAMLRIPLLQEIPRTAL